MAQESTRPPNDSEHATRVHDAFDALQERLAGRLDDQSRESLAALRAAAAEKNAEQMRAELTAVQERHGWLYRELAEHPEIATLLDELALWGF
jgi:Tfp pilus assembly protein PilO